MNPNEDLPPRTWSTSRLVYHLAQHAARAEMATMALAEKPTQNEVDLANRVWAELERRVPVTP